MNISSNPGPSPTTSEHQGHAIVTTFEGNDVSSRRIYCAGTPPNHSCYYPDVAWFCPECGEIWRRQVHSFDFTYRPLVRGRWKVYSADCPACEAPRTREIFLQLLKEYE